MLTAPLGRPEQIINSAGRLEQSFIEIDYNNRVLQAFLSLTSSLYILDPLFSIVGELAEMVSIDQVSAGSG